MLKESTLDPPEILGVPWTLLMNFGLSVVRNNYLDLSKDHITKAISGILGWRAKGNNTGKWMRNERHSPCCCVVEREGGGDIAIIDYRKSSLSCPLNI